LDGNFRVGQWLVQPQLNLIQGPGGGTSVEPKAMDVLVCLAKQAGEVVAKEQLMRAVWADTFVTDEVLTNSIWELRKAFHDDAKNPKVIQTVFKKGYRLIASVSFEGKATELGLSRPPFDKGGLQGGSRRKWIGVAIVVALLVAAAVALRSTRRVSPPPSLPSKVVPLTSLKGREIQPSFSPDGSQVAFVWNGENGDNWDVYLKVIGSEKALRLTKDTSRDFSPVWSPDGRQIAFIRLSGKQRTVLVIPTLGGPERTLYANDDRFAVPTPTLAWSPDGKLIALAESPLDSNESRIVLISPETNERRTLLSSSLDPAYLYSHPRFSPDGRLLAFRSSPSFSNADVHTIDLASGKINRLGLTKFNLFGFDFTTDGREIIFSTDASTWRVSISQGEPERITWIEPGASNPSTSRRGNSLVYSQDRSDNNIWKIDLSRGPVFPSVGRLFLSSTRYEGTPQFSADGSRILFTSTRSSIAGEIWVCDADGSNPRQITSSSGPDGEPPLFKGSPRWSPDGQAIAFDWTTEGHRDIYVVSMEGGKPKRLTTETSSDVRPSWSRDGRWVYFGSNRSGAWQLWKVPSTGGQAVQLTERGGREALCTTPRASISQSFGTSPQRAATRR
jgi:Tol biopolymer transport system component/DNA-binding winged helix-turn-helix (wHTH) protein